MSQPAITRDLGRTASGKVIPHVRDDDVAKQIAEWVALGATLNEIAVYLNLRPGVLKKNYKKELETGKFENDMAVGGTILKLAKAGVPQFSIFYAQARMGWRTSDKADSNNDALLNIHIHT